MKDSKIEWCHHTFNPWIGCSKVSEGCAFCYAESRDKRHLIEDVDHWGKGAPRYRTKPANWKQPLAWAREAAGAAVRPRVFCASQADWLDDEVPWQWRFDLLELIRETPELDWLLLTKRPENFAKLVTKEAAHETRLGALPPRPVPDLGLPLPLQAMGRVQHRGRPPGQARHRPPSRRPGVDPVPQPHLESSGHLVTLMNAHQHPREGLSARSPSASISG